MHADSITIVSCSILKEELLLLHRNEWPETEIRFLDSMLHMHPRQLGWMLNPVIDEVLAQGRGVLLIYGDCCPHMATLSTQPNVARVPVSNCCELLLGRGEYRRLIREGVFFMMPEWVRRWQEVFAVELGLNLENARSFMKDMHQRLVYLDTGLEPVPAALAECSVYCGLPYEILTPSLDTMRVAIDEAMASLQR